LEPKNDEFPNEVFAKAGSRKYAWKLAS